MYYFNFPRRSFALPRRDFCDPRRKFMIWEFSPPYFQCPAGSLLGGVFSDNSIFFIQQLFSNLHSLGYCYEMKIYG